MLAIPGLPEKKQSFSKSVRISVLRDQKEEWIPAKKLRE